MASHVSCVTFSSFALSRAAPSRLGRRLHLGHSPRRYELSFEKLLELILARVLPVRVEILREAIALDAIDCRVKQSAAKAQSLVASAESRLFPGDNPNWREVFPVKYPQERITINQRGRRTGLKH